MSNLKKKKSRNSDYLKWIDRQPCCVTGFNTDNYSITHHHVRIGNEGGTGLKPSDYRCIPLSMYCHTIGLNCVHSMGERSFFKHHDFDPDKTIVRLLLQYISKKHPTTSLKSVIEALEDVIEENR